MRSATPITPPSLGLAFRGPQQRIEDILRYSVSLLSRTTASAPFSSRRG
jgi:hypothetical protein